MFGKKNVGKLNYAPENLQGHSFKFGINYVIYYINAEYFEITLK